jgi:hypothetical protein
LIIDAACCFAVTNMYSKRKSAVKEPTFFNSRPSQDRKHCAWGADESAAAEFEAVNDAADAAADDTADDVAVAGDGTTRSAAYNASNSGK